jgi:hypothetical protein
VFWFAFAIEIIFNEVKAIAITSKANTNLFEFFILVSPLFFIGQIDCKAEYYVKKKIALGENFLL